MSHREEDLKLKRAFVTYMIAFSSPLPNDICRAQSIRMLRSKGLDAKWEPPDSKDFEAVESFLFPGPLLEEFFRVRLDDVVLTLKKDSGSSLKEVQIPVGTYLTVYPKVDVCVLLLNIKVVDWATDDAIFLIQCLDGRFEINVDFPSTLRMNGDCSHISPRRMFEEYIRLVLRAFNIPIKQLRISAAWCIEIQDLDTSIQDPERLVEKFPQQIYGIAYSDEGWRFVPVQTAISGLSKRWGTREFQTVIPFGFNGILVINFHHGRVYKEYVESQTRLREQYKQTVEEYFTFSPEIAGLNHGALFLLENALVQRVIIEQSMEQVAEKVPRRIKQFLELRDHLVLTLAKLSRIENPQSRVLGKRFQESLQIEKNKEDLRRRLEEVQGTLILKYNQRIDLWVIILALSSLIIGVLSILVQVGLLDRIIR